jgi:trans-2,3-dihydro-3-hydroxyanthranilate isomerase
MVTSTGIPFYIVDVFATTRYTGNPLVVFTEAAAMTAEQMLQIAREINFQETTFVVGGSVESGFDVRIFTPEYEVPFAGHPTLGTAYVLAKQAEQIGDVPLRLNLPVGRILVNWQADSLWLGTTTPRFGPLFSHAEMASLLHLPADALITDKPIEWVSTGLPYLIVPIRSLSAMQSIRLDTEAVEKWLLDKQLHTNTSPDGLTTAFYCYCEETYGTDNQLNARMFCLERGKIVEDYATGSAASCLLAYLVKQRSPETSRTHVRLEQGYEAGRPSLIELDGSIDEQGQYHLRIGGQVHFVAKGEWMV